MENNNYLTEEKLGIILKDIWPEFNIEKQVKFGNKRFDYQIIVPKSQFNKIRYILNALQLNEEDEDYIENMHIIIEFDGHYHYTNNGVASFEDTGCAWVEYNGLDSCILRIPYWLQLDKTITWQFFGVSKDYSEGYKHGFISKNCILPGQYCSLGEQRFIKELKSLPPNISTEIVNSLIIKSHNTYGEYCPKKMANCGSLSLWKKIIKFHPYKKIIKVFNKISPDESKFYKRFDRDLLDVYLTHPICASIYHNFYKKNETKESIVEFFRHLPE